MYLLYLYTVPVSKINSETSFLYQLFKENSNFIVESHTRLFICLFFMMFIIIHIYLYVYLCIYTPLYPHFKAFPVSKFNSETSFLYQLFKAFGEFKYHRFKARQANKWSYFFDFHYYLYLVICLFMHLHNFISTF